MTIILFITYLTYPLLSGIKDAILWSRKGADAFPWDEHRIFNLERFVAVGLSIIVSTVLAYFRLIDLWQASIAWICSPMAFPFVHNGFYYLGRSKIDGAYKGFFDQSTSSTANVNFSPKLRTILFIISILIIISYEIFIY